VEPAYPDPRFNLPDDPLRLTAIGPLALVPVTLFNIPTVSWQNALTRLVVTRPAAD
jgi:hypothetical protein